MIVQLLAQFLAVAALAADPTDGTLATPARSSALAPAPQEGATQASALYHWSGRVARVQDNAELLTSLRRLRDHITSKYPEDVSIQVFTEFMRGERTTFHWMGSALNMVTVGSFGAKLAGDPTYAELRGAVL